ncbi:hypothetical protein [Amycolatopsis lurida]|uniref:hypothetical protein n=1 Tax=Amycolatopsis lurida TaxID=31959 RepID=UPI000A51A5F2|nr:hypothetical protein [Amycolatopsis lurida]
MRLGILGLAVLGGRTWHVGRVKLPATDRSSVEQNVPATFAYRHAIIASQVDRFLFA